MKESKDKVQVEEYAYNIKYLNGCWYICIYMKICNCWSVEPNDTWLLVEAKRLGGGGTTGGGPGLPNATGGSDYRFGDIVCSPGGGKSGYDKRIDPNNKGKVIGFDQEGVNDNNEKVGNKRIESKPSLKNVENGANIGKYIQRSNTAISGTGLALGTQEKLLDFAIRSDNKVSYKQFKNLSPKERSVLTTKTLTKVGSKGLTFLKGLGVAGGAINIGLTGFSLYEYGESGGSDWRVYFKGGLDVGMTAVGFCGIWGFAASSVYFIIDASTNSFGGFGDPNSP